MDTVSVVPADEAHVPFLATKGAEMFAASHRDAMNPNDLEEYLGEAFDPERVWRHVQRTDNLFLIAEIGNEPVGYARLVDGPVSPLVVSDAPIEIRRFYVLPGHQGRGVGRALLDESVSCSMRREKSICWLHVWEQNDRAIRFYERGGFRSIGREGSPYRSSNPIALVMVRDLSASIP